jgi:hypothetical protein
VDILAFGGGILLIGVTAVAAASCLRLRSAVAFLLAASLVGSAEVVALSLALSPTSSLNRPAFLVGLASICALAVVIWARVGRPRQSLTGVGEAVLEALRDRAVAALTVLNVALYGYLAAVALSVPQSLPDTMLYHLPRAALWRQQHAVRYVPGSPDERIDAFPPVAEIQSLTTMLLARGDRFVGLVQLLALASACIAIVGIARRLGLTRAAAGYGAAVFATFTVVALQAPTALNDLVVASFLIVCAYFALGSSRTELALAALALALAIGTKGTALFALPALALFVLSAQPRTRWLRVVGWGLAGLVAGSFWYAVNLVRADHVTGGIALDQGTASVVERLRLSVLDLVEMSDAEGVGLVVSAWWSVAGFGVAVAVAIVLLVRGRTRPAAVAALAGLALVVVAPLLVTWVGVADRIAGRAFAVVGLASSAPSSRLPDGFNESPMHSSFGLAFVVLLLGVGVLAVRDVRRRELPFAVLAALIAVPLTLLVTVLALAYDPQRMRYIVFAAALAASVFGVALRVRALAWTAVALATATSLISIAYFVPRPASLALLSENRDSERSARWFIQAEGGGGDPAAFRFLAERVPPDATLALAMTRNTYLYPAWDPKLERTVLFVPADGELPPSARWLVVGPGRSVEPDDLEGGGWSPELTSPGGWRIFGR